MVRLALLIKAELENVTNLEPASQDFEWFFKVKCNSCHETHPKMVTVNRLDERELSTGKDNTANFVWRCSLCKRESSAKFDKFDNKIGSIRPYTYEASERSEFLPLVILDCRGLEFVAFDPKGVWKCIGIDSATSFNEVDLEDGEWTDYDEKSSKPVGVMAIESKWERA